MVNVLKEIYTLISAVIDRVYSGVADDEAVYPYAAYRCPTVTGMGKYTQGRDDVILEIDIWDNIKDETRIEGLIRSLDVALNGKQVSTDSVKMRFDKLTILNLPDPDGFLHRQLRYRIITYQFD